MDFNSGIEFNTEDMYRIVYENEQWFVVGKGERHPAINEEDAKKILSDLT